MDRKYNIKLDLQFRCNNSVMKFSEFDNNTSDFFMRITNDFEDVEVENALVVLAAIKPSGKVASQFIKVENGLVYADLDPSLKNEVGPYTAQVMLILENERVVTDAIKYEVTEDKIFGLLNETASKTEEFTLLNDMFSRLSTIEINEKTRISNEVDRLDLQKRLEELIKEVEVAEVDRYEHEVLREKTHLKMKDTLEESKSINTNTSSTNELAKSLIKKVELTHEDVKATHEKMINTESRVSEIENDIKENEAERQKFYGNNQLLMQQFKNSEFQREAAETIRIKNEDIRQLNIDIYEKRYDKLITDTDKLKEDLTVINTTATQNEESRLQAEIARTEEHSKKIAEVDNKIKEVDGFAKDKEAQVAEAINNIPSKDELIGPQGPAGNVGPRGEIGPVGPQGPQGIKGDPGSKDLVEISVEEIDSIFSSIFKNGINPLRGNDAMILPNDEEEDEWMY